VKIKLIACAGLSGLALTLTACGGSDSDGTAFPAPSSSSASDPGELDPADCTEPEFFEEYVEFCVNSGVVDGSGNPAEGSVTTEEGSYVEYSDGLHAVISDVTAGPADETIIEDERPELDGLVTITMTISNEGGAPIQLNNDAFGTSQVNLYYGENRYEAQGWMTEGGVGDLPQRLVPGSSAEFTSRFTLPTAEMGGPLAVAFNPDSSIYLTYTFTDVETLIGA
jgi:hypothetical protein